LACSFIIRKPLLAQLLRAKKIGTLPSAVEDEPVILVDNYARKKV
jgi:hypothetical protein